MHTLPSRYLKNFVVIGFFVFFTGSLRALVVFTCLTCRQIIVGLIHKRRFNFRADYAPYSSQANQQNVEKASRIVQ